MENRFISRKNLVITDVKTFLIGTERKDLLWVKIETDSGISGVGEGTLEGKSYLVSQVVSNLKTRHLIGKDPFNVEEIWLSIYRNEYWQGGPVMMTYLSAVEIALWDIIGKALNQPVWRLLGGKVRDHIRAYANGWSFGAKDPQSYYEKAKEVVSKGYSALKFDPFAPYGRELSIQEKMKSIEIVEAVYSAVGEKIEIMIEGHGRFGTDTAIEISRMLERFNPFWFEEPVSYDNLDAIERVYKKSNIRIAAGERLYSKYGFRDIIKRGCVGVIQPDPTHAGGILEVKKIAAMADAEYIPVALHNPSGPISTSVCLQIAGCTTNYLIQEAFQDFDVPYLKDLVTWYPKVIDGFFEIPDRPGLGLELVEDAILEHPYQSKDFNIWVGNKL
ncbi:MAG: hypothetical protein JM58_14665 [Peptococcaceae bacterium BICA1-8]|nr:MAG: hypothetical protein JM58_14665 [Peptococcaceae bacterium BICA1-8]